MTTTFPSFIPAKCNFPKTSLDSWKPHNFPQICWNSQSRDTFSRNRNADCDFSSANSICKHSCVLLFSPRINLTRFLRRWQRWGNKHALELRRKDQSLSLSQTCFVKRFHQISYQARITITFEVLKLQTFWFRQSVSLYTASENDRCELQTNVFSQKYQQNLLLPLMRAAMCTRGFTVVVSYSSF